VKVFINARFTVQGLTGVQRFAGEITRALGPDVTMLAPARGGALAGHLWEQAVLPWRARDGVLVNLGNTAPIIAGRQVVVIHDAGVFATPEAYSAKFRAWYGFLQRRLVHGRAVVATVSAFSRAEIGRVFGIDASCIPVLGEGAEHLLAVPPDATVLTRNALEPGRFVLAVGSLAAHKNLAALGPTAAMLGARGMTLVVTGGFNRTVFGAVSGAPQAARSVGRVDDAGLRALYEAAACFVFPSRYEGFGLPAAEAMASGCPVIAAKAGALPEVCGEAAVYCDPASAADIARAVATVLDDPARAAELRGRGRARAAELTWARAAAALHEVIAHCGQGL